MKKITLFLVSLVFAGALWAQNVQVSGVVTDIEGQTQPGVSVVVKGTQTSATTDVNGRYTISAPGDATLVFSSMGMATVEMPVDNRSTINVTMEIDAISLEDVVITGYGVQRRGSMTGSVTTVKAEKIEFVPVANFQQLLQGEAPGVQVTAASGRPGSGAAVKVRGTGSISAGSAPLYVIDGFPLSVGDFASINPNDIESMTVLKDASATSIYGSRGANGVIVVTTKQGLEGRTRVTARAQYGVITKGTTNFDVMNAQEILTYENRLGRGKGAGMTLQEIENYDGPDTDWVKELFRVGNTQTYEVAVNGGDKKTKFYVSGQYYTQDGMVYGSYLDRVSGRVNLSHEISQWVDIGLNFGVSYYEESGVRESRNILNPMMAAYSNLPYTYPFEEDGSYHTDNYMDSGLNTFKEIDKAPSIDKTLREMGSVYLNWKPIKQLTYRSSFGIDLLDYKWYAYQMPAAGLSEILGYSSRTDQAARYLTYNWTNTLTFQDTYADVHNVKAILGAEILRYHYEYAAASRIGFTFEDVDALSMGSTVDDASGGFADYALASFFLNAAYDYDGKYLLDAAVRRDGASRFGPNNRWGTFWAVGAGWNVHREEFMQNFSDILSSLKIRGSYGTSGNFNIGDYAWRGTFGFASYDGKSSTYQTAIANKDLTWETNYQFSIGFDFGLFDNRLSGSFDWYNRDTKDLLLASQLSRTSGFLSRTENIGEINNKGIEIMLKGDIIKTAEWLWSMNASLSYNVNQVVKLTSSEPITTNSGLTIIQEGYPINNFYMTRYAGVDPATGMGLFYDKEGNISTNQMPDYDVILDGKTPDPKYYGTVGTNVSWNGIDLSASFYYSYGNYIFNLTRWNMESDGAYAGSQNHLRSALYDAWQKPGDITSIPKQSIEANTPGTTRFLEDGSFIRLRNVTLSYTLPKKWIEPVKLEKVRVYAQAENLFTITKYKGFDPEVGTHLEGTAWTSGAVDDFNYPIGRSITFGIDITL